MNKIIELVKSLDVFLFLFLYELLVLRYIK